MRERTGIFVVGFIFSVIHAFAQNLGTLSGNVFDAKTKEPLVGTTVYLANTAIGTIANNDGSFALHDIHPGKYNLTASMIGYKTFSKPVLLDGNSITGVSIFLEEKIEELKSIEVTAKRSNSRLDFTQFKREFLGQTLNSYQCEIINIHDIFVYKDGSQLHALAHQPIEIENKALGYRIHYELIDFILDYLSNTVVLAGIPRFENLVPKNEKQQKKWTKERDRAYYGSEYHFFRSLKKRELKFNHFSLYDPYGNEIHENNLLPLNNDSTIHYKGNLKVVFDGEYPEIGFPVKSGWQVSTIYFSGNPVTIYANGYYQDYRDATLLGYMGWSNRIADTLPLDYQPTSRLKK